MARTVATLAILCVGLVAAQSPQTNAPTDPCASFTRCSECVYDSYATMQLRPLDCRWCEETMSCSSVAAATCPTVRALTDDSPMCSDMQCSAARTTGNIYWCRAGTIVSAIFAFELFVVSVLYWFWMRAVHQVPWKFPTIHQTIERLQASPMGTQVELVAGPRSTHEACPICHVTTGKTYGPGAVCFWCDVARYAFIPFVVGMGGSLVAIFSLFAMSLRPSFGDWYYGVLLGIPHALYVTFAAWVALTQRPVYGDHEQRKSMFVGLAFVLRGRAIGSVFDIVVPEPPKAEPSSAIEPGQNPASPASESEQHVDTMQDLELDTSLPASFRQELRDTLRPDEFIAWSARPSSTVILVENRWLVASFAAGAVVGLFFILASGIQASVYPPAFLNPTSARALGFIMFFFNAAMLTVAFSSMHRLYVLTNKRLILLSSGMFASTHMIQSELMNVAWAAIHGYQELGYTVLKFSWGEKGPARKMPNSKMTEFVGVVTVEDLLQKFGQYCHSLDASIIKTKNEQQRTTWRVHIAVLVIVSSLAPLVFIAPRLLPPELCLFGLVIVWFFCGTFAQRGYRVLSTTSAPLHMTKSWGRYTGFKLSRLVPGAIRFLPYKGFQSSSPASPKDSA